jgi:hypothetical protein
MADYSAIITAIDAAIEEWVGEPVSLADGHGRQVTYRSLSQLLEARKYYAELQTHINNKKPFGVINLKATGAR